MKAFILGVLAAIGIAVGTYVAIHTLNWELGQALQLTGRPALSARRDHPAPADGTAITPSLLGSRQDAQGLARVDLIGVLEHRLARLEDLHVL